MIDSPENFHITRTKLINILNKLSRNKLQTFLDKRAIRKNSNGQDVREFYVDWKTKNYNRISVVNNMIANCASDSKIRYLEIGCAGDKLFQSVMAYEKIGVDPFAGGTHRMTSDEFFGTDSSNFDVVFVDGLHEYNQVWKDVKNSLSQIPVGGYIGIHDMLPRTWVEAYIPCLYDGPWTGDVWKLAFDLMDNPGIKFNILNIDHGVGVIKKIEENAELTLSSNFGSESYSFYADNRHKLPVIEFNEYNF